MEKQKTTIEEYIASAPNEIKEKLNKLLQTIRDFVPEVKEKISWGMPTFYLQHNIFHFAFFKNHIGIYPGAAVVVEFKDKLNDFKYSKGGIQIPHDKPLPMDLIKDILAYRIKMDI